MADIMAKTIKFPGLNNTYEFMQPDGTYPDLTAGNIISNDAYNEDTEPYLFRALPYKSKRLEESLVGGSVVWNQLADNSTAPSDRGGYTITGGDEYFTVDGPASAVTVSGTGWFKLDAAHAPNIVNHKVLVSYQLISGTVSDPSRVTFNVSNTTGNFVYLGETKILSMGATVNASYWGIYSNVSCTNAKMQLQVVDLTQFFGNSTIADAIYAMETANAGSGVAFMRKYFPKLFDAEYDAGTLKSVNPTAHKMVGVNAWDEEWEIGSIDANTGANISSNVRLRAKNYINCIPNTSYYFKVDSKYNISGWYSVVCYDANKNCVGTVYPNMNTAFTTPSDAYYMRFVIPDGWAGREYTGGICINISDLTINGKYFSYEEHTYDLGNVPLYGLFQLVDNKLKAYGDVRHAVGGTDRKFVLLDLGTLDWTYIAGDTVFRAYLADKKDGNAQFICSKYTRVADAGYSTPDYCISYSNSSSLLKMIFIGDPNYTDAATFKQAMSGVYLVYEKATPTTEDTPSFKKIQSCFPYGTEQYITTNDVPVGHETKYFKDVITDIAGIPEPPSANGTYELKLTITDGVASYSWVAV